MNSISKTKRAGIAVAAAILTLLALRLALVPPSAERRDKVFATSDPELQSRAEKPSVPEAIETQKTQKHAADAATSMNLQAASEKASSMIACHLLLETEREAEFRLKLSANSATLEQLVGSESQLGSFGEQLRKREHSCDSIDIESVSKDLYPSLLLAARLGDTDAASCYASADFPQNADELQPDKIAEFQKNALDFLDAGMKRGDWRFVEIALSASSRYSVRDHYAILRAWNRHLLPADKIAAYGYERLLRYGLSGELAEQIDVSLASQRENLNPDKVDAMDKWARDQYLKYFQYSPVLTESPQICPMWR